MGPNYWTITDFISSPFDELRERPPRPQTLMIECIPLSPGDRRQLPRLSRSRSCSVPSVDEVERPVGTESSAVWVDSGSQAVRVSHPALVKFFPRRLQIRRPWVHRSLADRCRFRGREQRRTERWREQAGDTTNRVLDHSQSALWYHETSTRHLSPPFVKFLLRARTTYRPSVSVAIS